MSRTLTACRDETPDRSTKGQRKETQTSLLNSCVKSCGICLEASVVQPQVSTILEEISQALRLSRSPCPSPAVCLSGVKLHEIAVQADDNLSVGQRDRARRSKCRGENELEPVSFVERKRFATAVSTPEYIERWICGRRMLRTYRRGSSF